MSNSKSVRIDGEIYKEVAEMADLNGLKTAGLLGIVLRQGLESIRADGIKMLNNEDKNAEIDTIGLLNAGGCAAKGGVESINKWLNKLTPQEENAIKYSIKMWRAQAQEVANGKELEQLPALIKEGDRLSLWGRTKFLPWWDGLSKNIQAELKSEHWPKWRFDSGRATQHLDQGGQPLGYSTYQNFLQQNSLDDSGMTHEQKAEAEMLQEANKAVKDAAPMA